MKNLKGKTLAFIVVLLSLLIVSCSENPGTTTMKLILRTSPESAGKTLAPSNSSLLEVTKYTVTGNGPNGKTFTKSSSSDSIVIDGLTIGEWTINAKGLNSESTELCSGTLSFRLSGSSGPQTVILDTLVGTGTLVLDLDWSLCDIGNPDIRLYLKGPEPDSRETEVSATRNLEDKRATLSTSLPSGSYTIRASLMDGQTQVAGFVEAVRISNGMTTSGSHQFNYNVLGPGTLTYFKDATGTPIRGSLSVQGSPESIIAGTRYTCEFCFDEPESVSTDGLSIQWYYDGTFLESFSLDCEGSSMDIVPQAGTHRVDAVVYNKLLGSTGSASYSFCARPDGVKGQAVLIDPDASNGFEVNPSSMVGALPHNRLLVFDPLDHSLAVCTVNGSNVNPAKVYTADDFAFFNGVKKLFSDKRMGQFVLIYTNSQNKESFAFMNVDERTGAVTFIRSWEGLSGNEVNMGNLCAVDFNSTRSLITICDDTAKFDCTYYVAADQARCTANQTKLYAKYYPTVAAVSSENGCRYAFSTSSLTPVVAGYMTSEAGYFTGATESEPNDSYMTSLGWVGDSIIVGGNGLGLYTFRLIEKGTHEKLKETPIYVSMMRMDYTTGYTYVADNSRRIVSFEISSGGNITTLGSQELGQVPVSMAMTDSYLAVITADGRLALLGILE